MSRTYVILRTTDTIKRAIENRSFKHAHQALVELHDGIREYAVDDSVYDEVLEDVEALREVFETHNRASIDALSDSLVSELSDTIQRVQGLYLRTATTEADETDSIEQLREERDFYCEKLREYERNLRELEKTLHEKHLEMTEWRAKAEQKAEDVRQELERREKRMEETMENSLSPDWDED